MDSAHPSDCSDAGGQTPNRVRAERFGGPILAEDAEFSPSGLLIKKCELRSSTGKLATLRGSELRFRDGTKLSFETFRAGVRPRHGRTVLVDTSGKLRAEAEWSAIDHYFQVHGGDCSYSVDRMEKRHGWQIHADGLIAGFDHQIVHVMDTVPLIAVVLAWKVARTIEHLPAFGTSRQKAWDRIEVLGS